jgi:ATP-dependent DNA helicase HFM1/MER3
MANGLATTNAKTKLGLLIYLPGSKWANNHSCKHFCCREGLDKPPPKPKKRVLPGTQKEDGLNQPTISASITRVPAIGSLPEIYGMKHRSAEVNNPDKASTAKTSTPQPGNRYLNQVRRPLSEKDKNIPVKQKKQESPKPVSSDYGDDSFDDLP